MMTSLQKFPLHCIIRKLTLFLNSQTYTLNDVLIVITIMSIQLNWLRLFNMTGIILLISNLFLGESNDVIYRKKLLKALKC